MAVVEVVVAMLSVASSIEKFANSFIQFPCVRALSDVRLQGRKYSTLSREGSHFISRDDTEVRGREA
jgi:hypothetical protein